MSPLVVVPVGGGGLASGVAVAIKALVPGARVIGVEPELAADARESLERGEIVGWSAADVSRTIADGTRTQALGRRTFAHLRAHLDGIVTVTRTGDRGRGPARRRAVAPRRRAERRPGPRGHRVPSWGARPARREGPVVGIVSGGNVDPAQYRAYLEAPLPG